MAAQIISPASGNRTYIITAKRMVSGDVLKYRNGFCVKKRYETRVAASSQIPLTRPPVGYAAE